MTKPANPVTLPLADFSPEHFLLKVDGSVATVTLNRPERKNPLTFESYRELTDFFRACAMDDKVKTVVVSGAGGNFSIVESFLRADIIVKTVMILLLLASLWRQNLTLQRAGLVVLILAGISTEVTLSPSVL